MRFKGARAAEPSYPCPDLADAAEADPQPGTPQGCQECLELGEQTWAHLRLCLACGHVGCCDSSPYRHAQAHHESTRHPVMRSFEPGETWRWCYLHQTLG